MSRVTEFSLKEKENEAVAKDGRLFCLCVSQFPYFILACVHVNMTHALQRKPLL